MGGKHKQAQRVKNNARPSSSGRSAERLGAAVPTPFASAFAAHKDAGTRSLALDEPLPQLDPALDPQFQLVLKKMNKKDGTTKLKALQEFRQLVETSDAEAVGLVTSLWCRVYVGLLAGTEGRVREAAHRAHEIVCIRAARSLAPHVRLLAAPWLAAVHDTYGPAAQAARDSLYAAFPDARRRTELAARCRRQLLRQALDALTAETRDERMVSCTLRAVAAACEQHQQPDDETAELLRCLLEDDRFWGPVGECERVGWAAVLAAACRDQWREAAAVNGERVLRATLPALWSAEAPDATSALWDAVLLLLPQYGDTVDLRSDLLAPLVRQLRDPGPGVVTRVCPALLPLLARLPMTIATDACEQLLEAMLECMRRPYVQHSRAELSAAAAAYMDVAQWSSSASAPAVCVRSVLCSDPVPRHSRSLLTELARLMRRWRGEPAERAWCELADLVREKSGAQCQQQLADVIVWLARPAPTSVGRSKDQRVTFGIDAGDASPRHTVQVLSSTNTVEENPWYMERVQRLAEKAACEWLCCCDDPQIVTALLTLLQEVGITRVIPHGRLRDAYDKFVLPALSDAAYTPQLVELAFMLLGAGVEDDFDKQAKLNALPDATVLHAAHLAQHEPYSSDIAISTWLRSSPKVRLAYVRVAREAAAFNDDLEDILDTGLLKRALQTDPPQCDAGCVEEVSDVLCDALDAGTSSQPLCELAAAACRHAPDRLAPRLLTVACSTAMHDRLGPQLIWDVDIAWRDAVNTHPDELLESLVPALQKVSATGYDDNAVACAVHLAVACGDPAVVLARPHLRSVEQQLERCVALAQIVAGHDISDLSLNDIQAAVLPNGQQLTAWLGWKRLVAAVLVRLLTQPPDDDIELDYDQYGSTFDSLTVHVLRVYALVASHARHYTHTECAELLHAWLKDAKKLCEQLMQLRPLTERSWWHGAPVADAPTSERVAWAASTAQLASDKLLPGGEQALGLHSAHTVHVAQAAGACGLLDPRRVPPAGDRPLLAARLAVSAADDGPSLDTAVAEALHALRRLEAMPTDSRHIAYACLLLETTLRRTHMNEALLDLATVRVAAWSDTIGCSKDIRLLAAYGKLVAAHSQAVTGERAQEYEQLFASDVRRAVVHMYTTVVTLAKRSAPAAWPLCATVQQAIAVLLVPAAAAHVNDALWCVSLEALGEAHCIPVQLCAYHCLSRLCDAAAVEGGKAPALLVTELARLADADAAGNDDVHSALGCVLAWDAAAVLHAAWEQPRVDRQLSRLLEHMPLDARDEWFTGEPCADVHMQHDILQRSACSAYTRWLCEAGAAARGWWAQSSLLTAADKHRAERIAARHVTRRAVRMQLSAARLPEGVRCSTAGRLVQAECQVEDARIELRIELGESWPLGQLAPRVVARPAPHRDRLMQLTLAAAAGAPLHHLLRLWKDAVDRRYEGLDECHICFSLLHAATAQLPKLRCPTCRKTFHSACLYRWFSTSNKSTCPICRNLF